LRGIRDPDRDVQFVIGERSRGRVRRNAAAASRRSPRTQASVNSAPRAARVVGIRARIAQSAERPAVPLFLDGSNDPYIPVGPTSHEV